MFTCKYCGWAVTEIRYNKQVIWVDQWSDGEVCGWDGNNSPHEPIKLNQQEARSSK